MLANRLPFYYGWIIVFLAFLMLCVSNGIGLGGLTVFDPDLEREFAANRGDLKIRDFLTLGLSALTAPLLGFVIDKLGVRALMMFGFALMATGLGLYGTANSLSNLYWIHGMFGLTLSCCGLMVSVSLVSRWFVKNRGLALGLALAGSSLGNAMFPPLAASMLENFGMDWRGASLWLALVPLIMIPLTFLFVRNKPEDVGLTIYGGESLDSTAQQKVTGYTYKEALKTLNFWLLAGMAMLTFYSILSFLSHLVFHMTDQGFSLTQAGQGMSVLFILGVIGKVFTGYVAEKIGHKPALVGCVALMFAGSLLFIAGEGNVLWLAIFTVGLGWGGLYTMLQYTTADIFGTRALGAIVGTITLLDATGGAMGPLVTGILYDRTGSYTAPFTLISTFIFIALLAALFVKVPKTEH